MKNIKEKILDTENKFKNFILDKKNLRILFLVIISILAVVIRISVIKFRSHDYENYLAKWIEQIKQMGGFRSLKYIIGDYNVPYIVFLTILSYIPISPLIFIKAFSIIFDFICAIYASKLVYSIVNKGETSKILSDICYALILFLPTVFINSSIWGQCDIIYVTFIIMSLYYLNKNRVFLSFVLLGVSFAFKLQFIFILPLYVLYYFKKKNISLLHFLLIPIVNIIMCLPAIIMGKSIKDCILIYFNQVSEYPKIVMGYPNLYNIFVEFFDSQSMVLVILTVIIIGILLYYILSKKIDLDKNIIRIGLMFSAIMVFFLPRMHERYGFLPEVLAVIHVLTSKKDYYILIILELMGIAGYWGYFASQIFNFSYFNIMAIIGFIGIAKFTIDTVKYLNKDSFKI